MEDVLQFGTDVERMIDGGLSEACQESDIVSKVSQEYSTLCQARLEKGSYSTAPADRRCM